MYLQKFLTPVVLAAMVIAQGCPGVYAQQPAPPPSQQPASQALNNDAVIKLAKAGLSDDLIVSTIANSPGVYDISADGMIALKSAGVSDRVVSAIVLKANTAAQPAQSSIPPLAPMPSPATGKILVPDGTDVYLVFDQDLSSKTAADGDLVALVLSEDIKIGGVVVAKAGAKAVGEVSNSEKSEMLGKGGELNIRLDYLKVGSEKVHLRGTKGTGGKDSTGGTIGLMMLCFICGVLHHGKEGKVAKGAALHAYVAEDISLAPAI
jgi:hypothetical protein